MQLTTVYCLTVLTYLWKKYWDYCKLNDILFLYNWHILIDSYFIYFKLPPNLLLLVSFLCIPCESQGHIVTYFPTLPRIPLSPFPCCLTFENQCDCTDQLIFYFVNFTISVWFCDGLFTCWVCSGISHFSLYILHLLFQL